MNKIWIVSKREYFKIVKKPVFWFSIIFLPLVLFVVLIVSSVSSQKLEKQFNDLGKEYKKILIYDPNNLIDKSIIDEKVFFDVESTETGKNLVSQNEAELFVDFSQSDLSKTQIFTKDFGVVSTLSLLSFPQNLIKLSIVSQISNLKLLEAFNSSSTIGEVFVLRNNGFSKFEFTPLIMFGASFFLLIGLTMGATNFLLLSFSEERENRMIESILTMISSKDLVMGKLIGLSLVVLTQMVLTILLGLIVFLLFKGISPIQFEYSIDLVLIFKYLVILLLDYLMIASLMILISSITTTYRESQSLSGIFIALTILPVYFIFYIILNPVGILSTLFSFLPLISPVIIMARISLNQINDLELVLSIVMNLLYIYLIFTVAYKVFKLNAFDSSKRLSISDVFSLLR